MTKLCGKLQNMNYKSLSACLHAEEEEKKGDEVSYLVPGGGGHWLPLLGGLTRKWWRSWRLTTAAQVAEVARSADGGLLASGVAGKNHSRCWYGKKRMKRKQGWLVKKNGVKAKFLANFPPNFIAPQYSKSTSIYRGWKRNILSLSGTNLGP
jgi:hypothetical protein